MANDDIDALTYLQSIYRNPIEATNVRMRAATEAVQYERPKLTAVATAALDGNSFGELLDRAIARVERSKQSPPIIEAKALPVPTVPASALKRPFARRRV